MRKLAAGFLLLVLVLPAFADRGKAEDKMRKAAREAAVGNFPKAEKLLREAVQEDPTSVRAHRMLGELLFQEQRYSQAADIYGAALRLDESQKQLNSDDKRAVTDNYGVATAMGGNLQKAKEIFEAAIKQDPEYPLHYYNLACTYAELGDLNPALNYLQEAWKRRANLSSGESFPDPRKDSSFKRYVDDKRFQEATKLMVF